MIVVDTNVIAYSMIQGEYTSLAQQVRRLDSEWRLPSLWRHEFLNVLAVFVQHGGTQAQEALLLWHKTVDLLSPCEQAVNLPMVLQLAIDYKITAYDAQFIALAISLNARCVTEDRGLLKAFPQIAISMKNFCSLQK